MSDTEGDRDQDDFVPQDEDLYDEQDAEDEILGDLFDEPAEELSEFEELNFDPDVQEINKYLERDSEEETLYD